MRWRAEMIHQPSKQVRWFGWLMLNDCGRLTSFMPASSGLGLPLRLLQCLQQAPGLSQFES